ncbi:MULTISPECIES: MotA/TolQ/ExbB proton channel family protein [Nostocales]|uniref:MotA/TolQ/ExbB proton channel family protein n=2 Tax=Aphanizomenonaceae TaxID=1892259 RepID=A0ACC7S077_DOLFA|nr:MULTISPECIES: MotA/TolQ/ExbB proton channel family protein [Nostocales]MBD2278334.1 MotA/TolQ/ExbB proton channel family protein [Aphanizomenon flos-aquae FACHB-1040]MBO1069454.1 MotA/TolQ/ExbB proton channel family protein [Dolichospermum sp. DEX189]MCX5980598.1 MotA/TolQ/ExbB proton channel family protein [Nostocales cyanobacterium LacPavin_0920_SED1_MAG_38_18]ALB42602.1 biopolymer transporter [Anabaena sp. WA102]MBO1064529.1 MotA/TolQ/ExbB proton channel family protein [Anabaena sp. 54]
MDILDLFKKGGPAMWPLLVLSVLSLSVIFERLWFWLRILAQEKEIVNRVIDAAGEDWGIAEAMAEQAIKQPVGRFLYAPLSLQKNDPETFRLALESTAADEIAGMRRGEKLLEAVIALSPLLGLLGTVLGLIRSLGAIRIGDLGTESTAGVTTGIGESLISTAAGLIVAIASLVFYRLFQSFVVNQVKIFNKAGNELELLYRQYPPEPKIINTGRLSKRTSTNFDSSSQLESKTFIQDPENRPNEPIDNYDLNLVNSANLPDNKVDDANLNFGEKPEDES